MASNSQPDTPQYTPKQVDTLEQKVLGVLSSRYPTSRRILCHMIAYCIVFYNIV